MLLQSINMCCSSEDGVFTEGLADFSTPATNHIQHVQHYGEGLLNSIWGKFLSAFD